MSATDQQDTLRCRHHCLLAAMCLDRATLQPKEEQVVEEERRSSVHYIKCLDLLK